MQRLIEDSAHIGDEQTTALAGRDGSVDWLRLRRFDSAACCARLLGDEENGRRRIAFKGPERGPASAAPTVPTPSYWTPSGKPPRARYASRP